MKAEPTVNPVSSGSFSNRSTAPENGGLPQRAGAGTRAGFNGEFHEPATDWQILGNGYRVYNPVLMRFHSPDSLSPFDKGGLNAYMYCAGDPVNQVDPTGHGLVSGFLRAIKVRPTVTTDSVKDLGVPPLLLFKPSFIKKARLKVSTELDVVNIRLIRKSLPEESFDDVTFEFLSGQLSDAGQSRAAYLIAEKFAEKNVGARVITKYARQGFAQKAEAIRAQQLGLAEAGNAASNNLRAAVRSESMRKQNLYL